LNIVIGDWLSKARPSGTSGLLVDSNQIDFEGGHFRFSPCHCYHSEIDLKHENRFRFRRNLSFFRKLLVEESPAHSLAFLLDEKRIEYFQSNFEMAFASRIGYGAHQVFQADLLRGIKSLKGCGLGLTPSGDDFIAGLLVGLNVLERMYRCDLRETIHAAFKAAEGDNVFSQTFLTLAHQGRLFGRMKNLITALALEDEHSIRMAAGKLLAIGASSGADVGVGFFMAVRDPEGVMARWSGGVTEEVGDTPFREISVSTRGEAIDREARVS
jgi:hypothetical protein